MNELTTLFTFRRAAARSLSTRTLFGKNSFTAQRRTFNLVPARKSSVSSTPETDQRQWTSESVRLGVIARKEGMRAIWDEWGVRVPVTVLKLENCQVIQVKHNEKDYKPGLVAVEVGCTDMKKNVTKALLGHHEKHGVPPKHKRMTFWITKDAVLPPGTELRSAHFVPGQYVDVQAKTIGKGFAGVMKRWGFAGAPASHGTSLVHRHAGSTGARQDPGRVFKGKKMAGRMGGKKHSVQNLKVVKIDNTLNLIYVKGHVPGFDRQFVRVRDAVRQKKSKLFPKDCIPPPFPTIDPKLLATMPRELIAKTGGSDPLIIKDR